VDILIIFSWKTIQPKNNTAKKQYSLELKIILSIGMTKSLFSLIGDIVDKARSFKTENDLTDV